MALERVADGYPSLMAQLLEEVTAAGAKQA